MRNFRCPGEEDRFCVDAGAVIQSRNTSDSVKFRLSPRSARLPRRECFIQRSNLVRIHVFRLSGTTRAARDGVDLGRMLHCLCKTLVVCLRCQHLARTAFRFLQPIDGLHYCSTNRSIWPNACRNIPGHRRNAKKSPPVFRPAGKSNSRRVGGDGVTISSRPRPVLLIVVITDIQMSDAKRDWGGSVCKAATL